MRSLVSLAALGLGVLAAGCSLSPKDDPSQFYVLASPAEAQPQTSGDLVLGLGPITVAGYLRRPQMVTRLTENEVQLSETYRWAENLADGITRVLKEELQRATGARQVRVYPWAVTRPVRYAVEVDVTRFEGNASGLVSLWAIWRVIDWNSREVVERRESRLTQLAAGTDPDAVVTAQSLAIGALSQQIAAAIPR